ncbi:hypothetical protein QYE76_031279 [Lolium multiflorum]|uniref:AP2/ERF domain-containing protein n=1 Tax=Lolium multiflorum TaxID=4521 RepID=A0AAD8QRG7_LOLMU|nr:hypothetical protein QYE76_031279 [Lolium multiflorum]
MDGAGASRGEDSAAPAQPLPSPPARRYKGVRLRKWGRWVSEIRMPNSRERIWLGSYESAEKAARAFDAAAVCLRGSRAGSLNFPESPPEVQHVPGALPTPERIQAEATRHANLACPAARAPAVTTAMASQLATSTSNDTSASLPSAGSAADDDDLLDWSFMDAWPAMPGSSASGASGEIVTAKDDAMFGFSPLPRSPPPEELAEDVIKDDGDDHGFLSDLWRF